MAVRRPIWRTAPFALGVGLLVLLTFLPTPRFGGAPAPHRDASAVAVAGSPSEAQEGDGMVVVPAGDFVMGGDPLNGTGAGQMVFVPEFMIDRTEVTNAAFAAFVLQTGYRTVAEQHGDRRFWGSDARQGLAAHPVVYIAFEDAIAYCGHGGKRLPSEREWEKAARGRDARLWPWGNDWDENKVNSMERGDVGTMPVGAFPTGASPYGLVDMAGNAWEWTASAYVAGSESDPAGRDAEVFRDHRVLRGGSWRTMAPGTRATYRKPAPPDYRRDSTGFRCARDGDSGQPWPEHTPPSKGVRMWVASVPQGGLTDGHRSAKTGPPPRRILFTCGMADAGSRATTSPADRRLAAAPSPRDLS